MNYVESEIRHKERTCIRPVDANDLAQRIRRVAMNIALDENGNAAESAVKFEGDVSTSMAIAEFIQDPTITRTLNYIDAQRVLDSLNEIYRNDVKQAMRDEIKSFEAEGVWKAIEAITRIAEEEQND